MRADDTCQIVALLGRELLGWGTAPPDISQFAIFYRPDGDGYAEQCTWAEIGIEALPPCQPDMDNMRYFTEPRYAEDRLAAFFGGRGTTEAGVAASSRRRRGGRRDWDERGGGWVPRRG